MDPYGELEEIADLEQQFLEELMAEPPHGDNHGRMRGPEGGWTPLETNPQDPPSHKRYVDPRTHGTPYTYVRIGCRCPLCRAWKAEAMRQYRRRIAAEASV